MISVIVPVYNVKDYLRRCVDSITSQDYKDLEIILVDDGSTDGSEGICDELGMWDNRIKVVHKENGGLSSARNIALDQMKGEYVFFVDSDDYIMPGILSRLYNACIINHAEISCCGYVSGKKKYYCDKKTEILNSVEAAKRMFICDGLDANAVCKLYDRRLFEKIRFPLCVHEVLPITYRVLLMADKIVNIYQAGYYIEKRIGSITRSPFGSNNLLYVRMAFDEYKVIKEKYPFLKDYSYVFYLNAIISTRECAEVDDECKQTPSFKQINNLFMEHYSDIKTNKLLIRRKKMIAVLIKHGIYRKAKAISHLFDKSRLVSCFR